jgi:hypothetical protein
VVYSLCYCPWMLNSCIVSRKTLSVVMLTTEFHIFAINI